MRPARTVGVLEQTPDCRHLSTSRLGRTEPRVERRFSLTGIENAEESVLEEQERQSGADSQVGRRPRTQDSGEVESEDDDSRGPDQQGTRAAEEDRRDQRPGGDWGPEEEEVEAEPDVRIDLHAERDVPDRRSEVGESSSGSSDQEEPGELAHSGGSSSDRSPEDVLEGITSELSPERREDLQHVLLTLMHQSSAETSWSAPLPEASDFYAYAPKDRERMLCWNDAGTTDESARQTKLVDARIEEARAGPRRAIFVVLVCLGLAAVAAFWLQDVYMAALFLSPPLLMFAQQIVASSTGVSISNGDK